MLTASHPLPPPELGELPSREEARSRLEIPVDRKVALFLGLIRAYKGVDLLLEAVSRQPADGNWLLVVAGEPWEDLGSVLEQQVRALGIEDRVRLRLGWVPETRSAHSCWQRPISWCCPTDRAPNRRWRLSHWQPVFPF